MRNNKRLWTHGLIGALCIVSCSALVGASAGRISRYSARIVWGTPYADSVFTLSRDPVIVALVPLLRLPPSVPRLHIEIQPPTARMPRIEWSVSDATRVRLSTGNPYVVPANAPGFALPPNEIAAAPGASLGPSWIRARLGPPVNLSLKIRAYTYRSVAVGCALGFEQSVAFAPERGVYRTYNASKSDLYVTGPAGNPNSPPFVGCRGRFVQASTYTLHVPAGGVLFPLRSPADFTKVGIQCWRNAFSELVGGVRGDGVLVLKTRMGAVVKILVTSHATSAYIISNNGKQFGDVEALEGGAWSCPKTVRTLPSVVPAPASSAAARR